MEKLLELLNEYEKVREKSEYQKLSNKEYKWFSSYFFPLCFGHQENFSGAMTNEFGEGTENVICSKKFGFIKWLVENDKIDFQIWKGEKYLEHPIGSDNFDGVHDYKDIIQRLSISDTPIKDLISYLK